MSPNPSPPESAEAHNNQGNLLQNLKRFEQAEAAYRQALCLKPDYAEAHNNLGVVLKEQKRYAEAEASYQQALYLKPDYAAAHYNRGNLLQEQKRYAEAETAYRWALRIKPDYAEAHNNLGNLLKEQKRYAEAESSYRNALDIDTKDTLGSVFSLAALGCEPLPLRVSKERVDTLYAKRSLYWDQTTTYYGAKLVASALRKSCNPPLAILDAGCGTGMVGVLIRDLAERLDGIDLSADMLGKAEQKNIYDHLEQGDLESFMVNHPQQYDAITCAATLIHFGDLASVFVAAAKTLRANGCFVFTLFPNETDLAVDKVVVNPHDGLGKGSCYAHGTGHIVRTAAAAGFVVEWLNREIHEHDANKIPIMCLVVVLRLPVMS